MPDSIATAPSGFRVDALSLKETHLLRLALTDTLPIIAALPKYKFKVTSALLFNEEHPDLLRVDVHLDATARPTGVGRTTIKASARLVVAVVFHYDELQSLQKSGELPIELGWTAVSIAYSTVRGIFQARLAGTSFDRALLPIVSPQQLWQPPASPTDTDVEDAN
jgi:hypothetical protein